MKPTKKELEELGEAIGWDWRQLVEAFGVPTDEAPDPRRAFGTYEGSNYSYRQSGFQNPYWAQQRTAHAPLLEQQQQHAAAGSQLQHALRAEQAARIAQMQAQLSQIVGFDDYDWRTIFYDPGGGLYRYLNQSDYSYRPGAGFQNPYWAQQRAQPSPFSSAAQQRASAGQSLQQALHAEQMARIAAMQAQIAPQPSAPAMSQSAAMPPMSPDTSDATTQDGGTIMGFIDDVLGAILPRNALVAAKPPTANDPHMGIVIRKSLSGRTFTSLAVNRNARFAPKKTLATARTVAARAQQVGARALTTMQRKQLTSVKGSPARPAVPKIGTAAVKALAKKTADAGVALGKHAMKYEGVLRAGAAAQASNGKRGAVATRVHGDLGRRGLVPGESPLIGAIGRRGLEPGMAMLGVDPGADLAFELATRELVGDDPQPVPDPLRPGLLTDGTPDPAYGATGGGTQAGAGVPGPPDYGAGTPPTMESVKAGLTPGLDYAPDPGPDTDTHFYTFADFQNVPGAVVFDGSQRPAAFSLGSFTKFYSGGILPEGPAPKGGPYSGYQIHDDGWWLLLQGTQPSTNYNGGKNYDKVDEPGYAMVAESAKNAWGPLVGAPSGWTRGLRFVPDGPNGPFWFWYFDTAMQVARWATLGILSAMLNDQITQYKAAVVAGQTDYLNAQLQEQLDRQTADQQAREQAKSDAALAQQQQQADMQEAQFEQQYAQQQAMLDLQNQKAQQAYASAHPELFYDPAAQQYQQPQGAYDDGSGLPPEMQEQGGGDDGFGDTGLDDSQIDWGE